MLYTDECPYNCRFNCVMMVFQWQRDVIIAEVRACIREASYNALKATIAATTIPPTTTNVVQSTLGGWFFVFMFYSTLFVS